MRENDLASSSRRTSLRWEKYNIATSLERIRSFFPPESGFQIHLRNCIYDKKHLAPLAKNS